MISVIMVRDLGDKRFPAAMITFVFGVAVRPHLLDASTAATSCVERAAARPDRLERREVILWSSTSRS